MKQTTKLQKRQLWPLFIKEELMLPMHDNDESSSSNSFQLLQYQVTDCGLLSKEIVPNSHLGTVSFAKQTTAIDPNDNSSRSSSSSSSMITMTWNVTFETKEPSRTFLWQFITEQIISHTCNNFQAVMAIPRVYQRTTLLKSQDVTMTPQLVMEKWIQFCWKQGAGFPLPIPPVQTEGGNVRWIIPPFLKERLINTKTTTTGAGSNENCELQYRVKNPGLFTYQVHSHRGRVRFLSKSQDTNTIEMNWEIEIRPYHGWSFLVEAFTGAVVSCYARNFKCHINEGPDVMVALKPPREGGVGASEKLWQIRKDSWLGGVLDAHLKDSRDTVAQTVALFQPWTWGRTVDYDSVEERESWRDGYLSK